MAMKCTSCGGTVRYDIDKKLLVCDYCKRQVKVSEYKGKNDAIARKDHVDGQILDVFVCKNCGAHLCAPAEQIVSYCNYCGCESMELTKMQPKEMPTSISLFALSKKEVKRHYHRQVDKKLFVPDELLDNKYLSEFRGIYIPYWSTAVNIESDQFKVKGEKNFVYNDYDYHQEYEVEVAINGDVSGGFYDASECFDDTIAAEIAPFSNNAIRFKEGYLAGFYADMPTTPGKTYKKIAVENALDNVVNAISAKTHGLEFSKHEIKKNLESSIASDEHIELFPVWFLTWKKGKRVAYSVMNGQTGKLMAELPIDYKKFFKAVGIQTLIYFILLSITPFFNIPITIASVFSFVAFVSFILLTREIVYIRKKEQHVYDHGENKKRFWAKKKLKNSVGLKVILGILFFFIAIVAFLSAATVKTEKELLQMLMFYSFLSIFPAVICIINMLGIENKKGIFAIIFSEAAQVAGVMLTGLNRPEDYWYYIIGLLLIASVLVNSLTAIFYINELTTRPVPNFFRREGAKHEEEL